MIQACCIDYTKQKVAQFFGRMFLILFAKFSFQFTEFLSHFIPHICFVFPVKAHVPGLVLYSVCLDKRRQRIRNAT